MEPIKNNDDYVRVSINKKVSEDQIQLLNMAKSILSVEKDLNSGAEIKITVTDSEGFTEERSMKADEMMEFANNYSGYYRLFATICKVNIIVLGPKDEHIYFSGPKDLLKQIFTHFELLK